MTSSPNPRATSPNDALRAVKLWPDSPALQAEWLRAVGVVRGTTHGWLAEAHLPPANDSQKGQPHHGH